MISALKPYPANKPSGWNWLGDIPAHWGIVTGIAVFREKKQKNIGLQETQVLSLSYGKIVIKPPEKLHGLVPESFETYQIVGPGDIIIRATDLQNDWNSLRVGLVKDRGIITSAYICLNICNLLTPEYAHLLLHTYDLRKFFYGMGSGLRQNLDFTDFKRMSILVPPREEQNKIVQYIYWLDYQVNRYIRAKRRQIELLNEQKQAIIQQAVTRGLDPNVRLKPSGVEWLGDVPVHWTAWQIGHFANVGNGSTPSRGNSTYWTDEGFPWLNSSVVHQGMIINADQYVTEKALNECHLPRVKPGSVLVAITGQGKTRGTAAVLGIEATINQHIIYISPKLDLVLPEFLRLALVSSYSKLRAISDDSGSTKGALTCEIMKHFQVVLPPMDEQRNIVIGLSRQIVDQETAVKAVHREIDLLIEYRTRLITDVVTGKVDVRGVDIPNLSDSEFVEPSSDLELVSEEELDQEDESESFAEVGDADD